MTFTDKTASKVCPWGRQLNMSRLEMIWNQGGSARRDAGTVVEEAPIISTDEEEEGLDLKILGSFEGVQGWPHQNRDRSFSRRLTAFELGTFSSLS